MGTGSGAGKTTVAAMYCRYLSLNGKDVVPFKASNLSLNSYVTDDGKEIGMGQAFQALACGREAEGDMNPILLKPSGNGTIQLVLEGLPYADMDGVAEVDGRMLLEKACAAYDRLKNAHETVVCEGSGSPAEINLRDRDVANIGMMRERNIPAVLVGDIERGGVFAAIYGTWLLVPDDVRHLMKGFIINRFRGDPSILADGVKRIADLTGMRFLGTIGYAELRFPEEDSLSDSRGTLEGDDANTAFLKNLDILLEKAKGSGLDLEALDGLV